MTTLRRLTQKPGSAWKLSGCKHEPNESLCDYISCFNQPKNQLHQVPENNIINAFITGVNDKDLIRNISRKNNITTTKMFESPTSTQAAKTPSTSTSASTSRALMTN